VVWLDSNFFLIFLPFFHESIPQDTQETNPEGIFFFCYLEVPFLNVDEDDHVGTYRGTGHRLFKMIIFEN